MYNTYVFTVFSIHTYWLVYFILYDGQVVNLFNDSLSEAECKTKNK